MKTKNERRSRKSERHFQEKRNRKDEKSTQEKSQSHGERLGYVLESGV